MGSFAAFALQRLPDLARRLEQPDAAAWLVAQDRMVMDGVPMVLIWGDRLVDEAEAKLDWARQHGLVDTAQLDALRAEFTRDDPDTETIELP